MKKFAVIGLGRFGYYVAEAIFKDGHEVMAIDLDKETVQEIDGKSTQAIVMDATDKEALLPLALEEMDAVVVATGSRISVSILICLHLHEIGVKRIIAKAVDEDHGTILKKVGAHEVVYPERERARRLARSLSRPNILDFIPLTDEYDLIQVGTPGEFVGKTLSKLNLRSKYNVYIIGIKDTEKDAFVLVPQADYVIKETDILVMLGKTADISRIKALK